MSCSFLIILFIYFADADDAPQPEQTACTEKFCNKRGVCYINDYYKASCHCYTQYYMGKHCEIASNPCDQTKINFQETGIYPCGPATASCTAYYGVNQCNCKNKFVFGKSCQHISKYWVPVTAEGLTAVTSLEPESGSKTTISVGVVRHQDCVKYEIIVEGVSYVFEPKKFEKQKARTVLAYLRHLLPNERICEYSVQYKYCTSDLSFYYPLLSAYIFYFSKRRQTLVEN